MDIVKIYRVGEMEVQALRGVSFSVEAGAFVSLVGASGSGKTTLLDILGCLSRPTAGCYRFEGRDVGELDEMGLAKVRNEKIGFVFQTFHLLPRHTAMENVMLPLFYAGVGRRERAERAGAVLQAVGLADRGGHLPSQLSGGQQQRVAIARALVNHPSLILADEPTGNLDTASGREIIDLLARLHTEGRTVILVTHNRDVADRSERIITLRDGVITNDEQTCTAGPPVRQAGVQGR